MINLSKIAIITLLIIIVGTGGALAGRKKECAKAIGKTAWNGGRSTVGFAGAGAEIYRGGTGNYGIASGSKYWDKTKNSYKDAKAKCKRK